MFPIMYEPIMKALPVMIAVNPDLAFCGCGLVIVYNPYPATNSPPKNPNSDKVSLVSQLLTMS